MDPSQEIQSPHSIAALSKRISTQKKKNMTSDEVITYCMSRPRGIQRRLADTSDSNHSRLVNALRAAYTTSAHTRCGCPDAVPLNLRRRQTEA